MFNFFNRLFNFALLLPFKLANQSRVLSITVYIFKSLVIFRQMALQKVHHVNLDKTMFISCPFSKST